MESLIGKVPFLNGGLFEQGSDDERDGVTVPDEAIAAVLTGIFDHFNFTVMESTPFDIEVAVDPEMLGKVFEELVTGRHASGSYYTPRPVVSFMCREALKGYLEARDTGLKPTALATLVDEHRTEAIDVAAARRVAEALSEVTVVDPACGSGAYLLGMMQELVEIQTALYNAGVAAKTLYQLKLEIIERNLYGVDIDKFAVNIAMLRMWLSLAIDYDGDEPEPLPNLYFKVVCGDSLLGPDPQAGVEVQGGLGQDRDEMRRLGRLKADYMRSTAGSDKARTRKEISELEDSIRDALGFVGEPVGVVDWRVEFADVFSDRGGFDIAIANPPYVRYQKISSELKRALKPLYGDATVGQSDLYCHFYARALQMLRLGGVHVFVCSNSWLDTSYGAKLQEYLLRRARIHVIYESAIERQFSTADINTAISIISKTEPDDGHETRFVSLRSEFGLALRDRSQRREIVRTRSELLASAQYGRKYGSEKWGGVFLRAPDIYHHILEAYGDRLVRIGEVATVRRGVITGTNRFFFVSQQDVIDWSIEDRFLEPVMTTPRESRSIAVDVTSLPRQAFICHEPPSELVGTNALAYIEWGESQGFHTKSAPAARRLWYNLGERAMTRLATNIFVSNAARTFLASNPILFSDNFQTVEPRSSSVLALCAAMNSSLCQLAINVEGRVNFGQGVLELQTYEVANIKIIDPRLLGGASLAAFEADDWDLLTPSEARRNIDAMAFDSLGLTTGEQEAVYEGVAELIMNRQQKARSAG